MSLPPSKLRQILETLGDLAFLGLWAAFLFYIVAIVVNLL